MNFLSIFPAPHNWWLPNNLMTHLSPNSLLICYKVDFLELWYDFLLYHVIMNIDRAFLITTGVYRICSPNTEPDLQLGQTLWQIELNGSSFKFKLKFLDIISFRFPLSFTRDVGYSNMEADYRIDDHSMLESWNAWSKSEECGECLAFSTTVLKCLVFS